MAFSLVLRLPKSTPRLVRGSEKRSLEENHEEDDADDNRSPIRYCCRVKVKKVTPFRERAVMGGVGYTIVAPIERAKLLLLTQESNIAIAEEGEKSRKR
ncbi:hypothetical protein F2Q69_00057436 [Brassica cretica]|uniref:Uncharacterized protein n=1 Tax=Brassica cretica TaxID=69181 RepID=A0A8S9NBI5_BRACR|nr:hypothetical protein F2Q69_00057436 [Brassica cretica]